MQFVLLVSLMLSTLAFGQIESDCSNSCWTATDASCSEQGNYDDWTSAQSITFTPSCTGVFKFVCKTDCENCYACGSCARVIQVNTGAVIGRCRSTLDGNGSCEWQCEESAYDELPTLTQGTQYRLEVMLQKCPTARSCTSCGSCMAKARVFHPDANCTAW